MAIERGRRDGEEEEEVREKYVKERKKGTE